MFFGPLIFFPCLFNPFGKGLSLFLVSAVSFCFRDSLGEGMFLRRRCPYCRRWFHPHPRLKQRQKTCSWPECRQKQKRKSNQLWRAKNPNYFRTPYAQQQKEKYGTRADDKRRYRQQHPDYVRRNAGYVRKWRQKLRQAPVSPTSSDPHVSLEAEKTSSKVSV
jgi:hypothetical protein